MCINATLVSLSLTPKNVLQKKSLISTLSLHFAQFVPLSPSSSIVSSRHSSLACFELVSTTVHSRHLLLPSKYLLQPPSTASLKFAFSRSSLPLPAQLSTTLHHVGLRLRLRFLLRFTFPLSRSLHLNHHRPRLGRRRNPSSTKSDLCVFGHHRTTLCRLRFSKLYRSYRDSKRMYSLWFTRQGHHWTCSDWIGKDCCVCVADSTGFVG